MNRKRTLSTQVCLRNVNQNFFNTKLSDIRKIENKRIKPYLTINFAISILQSSHYI